MFLPLSALPNKNQSPLNFIGPSAVSCDTNSKGQEIVLRPKLNVSSTTWTLRWKEHLLKAIGSFTMKNNQHGPLPKSKEM